MAAPVERYADVNGTRIHYLEWGAATAQPLVLLHGIARCAHAFEHLAPHFADRYRVVAVDLRGHGDSGWGVKQIRAPIVYILGGASTIVPRHTQDELEAALPQVEIVTMEGLGHYPSDEDPEGFLAVVDDFLKTT